MIFKASRLMAILLLVVLAVASVAATSAAQQVTLTLYKWTSSQLTADRFEASMREFEKLHPNIKVEVNWISGNYSDAIAVRMASDQTIDVIQLRGDQLIPLGQAGNLFDLSQLWKGDTKFNLSLFYEAALAAGNWQGVQYALPAHAHTHVMFYNKDIFDQAGVAYPDNTWSWDTYTQQAKKLTVATSDKVTRFASTFSSGWDPWYVLYQTGTTPISADGTKTGLSAQSAAGWQWLASQMWDPYYASPW